VIGSGRGKGRGRGIGKWVWRHLSVVWASGRAPMEGQSEPSEDSRSCSCL